MAGTFFLGSPASLEKEKTLKPRDLDVRRGTGEKEKESNTQATRRACFEA